MDLVVGLIDKRTAKYVQGTQTDNLLTAYEFRITDIKNKPLDLTGCTVTFEGVQSNGNFYSPKKAATIVDAKSGLITFAFDSAAFSVVGNYRKALFLVTKGTERRYTQNFEIKVAEAPDITGEQAKIYVRQLEVIIDDYNNRVGGLVSSINGLKGQTDTLDQKQKELLETLANSDIITKEQFVKFLAGEEIELIFTEDLKAKISGSTVENPHSLKAVQYSSLLSASSTSWAEPATSNVAKVQALDGSTYTREEKAANGYMQQILFSWNLCEALARRLPGIFVALDLASVGEKVAWLKAKTNVTPAIWGYGSGPSGNNLNLRIWVETSKTWSNHISSTTSNSIAKVAFPSGISVPSHLDSNGVSNVIVYAEATNGTTASSITLDYANITYSIKLKLSDFFKPKKVWAWNDTGTERFTDVYPNENIFLEKTPPGMALYRPNSSSTPVSSSLRADGWQRIILDRANVYYLTELLSSKFMAFKTNETVTQSFRVRTDADVDLSKSVIFSWYNTTIGATHVTGKIEKVSSNEYILSSTLKIPEKLNNLSIRLFDLGTATNVISYYNSGSYLDFNEFKVEYSEERTSYTTAPSVDLLNSFPPYVGIGVIASKDPTNFVWSRSNEYIDFMFSRMTTMAQFTALATR